MLISIVGKSGCGKTTIAQTFKSLDTRIIHIDVDKISYHVLTLTKVKNQIREKFSEECIQHNEVQRKILGKIVFSSPEQMQILTDITWPSMEEIIDEIISKNQGKIIILDWLLLPKTKFFQQSDLKIWIESPTEIRLERAMKRAANKEVITPEYFLKRDAAGINYEEGKYDTVIDNSNNIDIEKEVQKIYDKSIISR